MGWLVSMLSTCKNGLTKQMLLEVSSSEAANFQGVLPQTLRCHELWYVSFRCHNCGRFLQNYRRLCYSQLLRWLHYLTVKTAYSVDKLGDSSMTSFTGIIRLCQYFRLLGVHSAFSKSLHTRSELDLSQCGARLALKLERTDQTKFKELYFGDLKPSLSSLGQTSWSWSSNNLILGLIWTLYVMAIWPKNGQKLHHFCSEIDFFSEKKFFCADPVEDFNTIILSHHWGLYDLRCGWDPRLY